MRRQKSLQKSGVKRSENDMEAWMYDVVCMMSGTATEGMICYNRTMPNIKQEVDNPATPTQNYQVCSPTTTLQNQEVICTKMDVPPDYGGGGGGGGSAGNGNGGGGSGSPGSPEMHHCSSTTQPLGTPEEGIKEEDMMPRRLCLVCGDIASGFHYGVASCEACKAFFKRTIQGNIEYTCPANGECEINKRRRKACQACRFQKCLRQGMLKEGVRLDRVRGGRQKYRRSTDPYIPVKTATLEEPVRVSVHINKHFLIFQVSVASGGSGEQINNKMVEALAACEPDILQVSNLSHTLDTDQRILGQMADLYDRELVGTIGWAKQIPGFSSLALNDQMRLLQSTWAEILTFSLAWRSVPNNGRLWFAQDFSLDERQARECHCIELYTHCIQIVERIQRLGLIKEEYYVLKALILANSDARSDEPQALYHFRDAILNSLSDCVAAVRPGQALRATQNMFLILPSLRQADGIVRKFWSSVCRTGKVPMNKLFVEMLEAAYYR
ncbi:PREDICTED: steroid hormone receptor ERR1 isoform X2 [Polistes dominula]|uniref:Steroid hormone receptor ERR1 isoform X2 n=1 Tax=Polistes dominula TaxID=743375 RepID=A0ABM1HUQ5_POLDO|nr:PREDICTED: steroid hormone receptor ERR1 isoform X2 [Polistes dominula]